MSTAGDGGENATAEEGGAESAPVTEGGGGSAEEGAGATGVQDSTPAGGGGIESTAGASVSAADLALARELNAPATPRMNAAAAALRCINADLNELADELLAAAVGSDVHLLRDLIARAPQ